MTVWEVCHYAFPDDDGETLERVLDELSSKVRAGMVGLSYDYSVLSVTKADAVYVLLTSGEKGVKLIKDGILYVPDPARQDCVTAMSDGNTLVEGWWRFLDVEFASAASKDAFEALSSKHGFCRQI
jgi:hypothetical protein